MNKYIPVVACAAIMMSASAAAANNNGLIILTQDELFNHADVAITGNENRLVISQEHTGGIGLNTISATITGDLNGGPLGARFTGAARENGLQPGRMSQHGFNNSMAIVVNGTSNLFAFSQNGSGNTLRASITGYENQAAVMQTGVNNYASLSQNGIGNIVSITQNSW